MTMGPKKHVFGIFCVFLLYTRKQCNLCSNNNSNKSNEMLKTCSLHLSAVNKSSTQRASSSFKKNHVGSYLVDSLISTHCSSSISFTCVANTNVFKYPQRKKLKGFKTGDIAGHNTAFPDTNCAGTTFGSKKLYSTQSCGLSPKASNQTFNEKRI